MLKAVLFDLDGTLIDSTDAIVASFWHMFDAIGEARPPREAILRGIGHPLHEELPLLTSHDPEECARIYRAHYNAHAPASTVLLPHAREALDTLDAAGMALGFGTSKSRPSAEMLLRGLGVLDRFSVRIGPEDVQHPKPHPECVLKALDAFPAAADEMVFVGDMHFDVEAAHAAGVRCVCVTTGYETREELEALKPDAVFDGLDEVARHLLAPRRVCASG